MWSYLLLLVFQTALLCNGAAKDKSSDEKELIMLELETLPREDRNKRSNDDAASRFVRQSAPLPPEYLSLLQQYSQQQPGAPQQRPQLVQQLLVARDGSKEPAAARYVLAQDGRVLQESLGLQAIQPSQPLPGRPVLSPELAAFSRAQTQLQQDYHDAPIHAQIAQLTDRPVYDPEQGRQPPQSGPDSPAPQTFGQSSAQALEQQNLRYQQQLQALEPELAQQLQLQVDPNAYLQQQLAQLTVANQATGRQIPPFQAATPPTPQPPRAQPQFQLQPRYQPQTPTRPPASRPIGPSAYAQFLPSQQQQAQPQPIRQSLPPQVIPRPAPPQPIPQSLPQQEFPQQYLIETSQPERQAPQPPQVQYVDRQTQQQQEEFISNLLSPAGGRGLFSPSPPQSSIYVTRSGAKPTPAPLAEDRVPVVRIPAPSGQRALSRSELDELIRAGYSITPVEREQSPINQVLKSKRTPLPLPTGRNHVVYHNLQDGVQYEYSPGSSDYSPPQKTKRDSDKKA